MFTSCAVHVHFQASNYPLAYQLLFLSPSASQKSRQVSATQSQGLHHAGKGRCHSASPMAATLAGEDWILQAALCPPPLSIQKKSRRPTFRRRIYRKPTHSDHNALGPLDDIIDQIKNDIWNSMPPSWTVTPLPISHIPNDQPLTIRKNRNSRSSASDSSADDPREYSPKSSRNEATYGGTVEFTVGAELSSAQQALENVMKNAITRPDAAKRHPSRLRPFTHGPLRSRTGTGDSTCDASATASLVADMCLAAHEKTGINLDARESSEDAVEVYMRRHVRKYGTCHHASPNI